MSKLSFEDWEKLSIKGMRDKWMKEKDMLEDFSIDEEALNSGYKEYLALVYLKRNNRLIESRKCLFLDLGKLKYFSIIEGFKYYDDREHIDKNIETLEKRKKERKEIIRRLGTENVEKEIEDLEGKIRNIDKKKERKRSKAQYDKIKRERDTIGTNYDNLCEKYIISQNNNAELLSEKEKLTSDLETLRSAYSDLSSQHELMISKSVATKAKVRQLRDENSDLDGMVDMLSDKIDKLRNKRKESKSKLDGIIKLIAKHNDEGIMESKKEVICPKQYRIELDELKDKQVKSDEILSSTMKELYKAEEKLRLQGEGLIKLKEDHETLRSRFVTFFQLYQKDHEE
jgi:chromosome segregation ATPase